MEVKTINKRNFPTIHIILLIFIWLSGCSSTAPATMSKESVRPYEYAGIIVFKFGLFVELDVAKDGICILRIGPSTEYQKFSPKIRAEAMKLLSQGRNSNFDGRLREASYAKQPYCVMEYATEYNDDVRVKLYSDLPLSWAKAIYREGRMQEPVNSRGPEELEAVMSVD